jgi:REP element-mobilizing transposase RayT
VCTHDRKSTLSRVVAPIEKNVGAGVLDRPRTEAHTYLNATVELLPNGIIADKYINQLNEFYKDISVENYVIMPNHIHLLLWVKTNDVSNGRSGTPAPTMSQNSRVSRFVSTFKRFCNKEYGCDIWQRGFYDHIIRNQEDFEKHIDYICNNPIKWEFDKLYSEEQNGW